MGEHNEASAERIDTDALQGGGDAALGMHSPAASAAGVPGGAQLAIGMPPQGRTPAEMQGDAARSEAVLAPRTLHARPELDDDYVGHYMQEAVERGGYRAALDYYGSDEAKKHMNRWSQLRARGWLLGRLGLYDQVKIWLEEATALPDFDYLSGTIGGHCRRAPYRTPPLWLETPKPVQYSAEHTLTVEPAAAPCPDSRAVPDYIWAVMLILDATGPIPSHAGLGAAMHLVEAEADWRAPGQARGDRRYAPLRGARLHGAPEGCHRWIIADINFDPWLVNKAHYYYDLTDEGRRALKSAKAAGPPWPKAVGAAASGLGGMTLPDLLEGACRLGTCPQNLGSIRDDFAKILRAWQDQENGTDVKAVGEADQPLVDLGVAAARPDADGGADAALDCLLHIMTIVKSVSTMACEAKPRSGAERAVVEALIGAIQGQCRRHAGAVVTAASATSPAPAFASGRPATKEEDMRRQPLYADATPALIGDLYYCLAEYCGSRSLAVDPLSLPPSERLAEDERAAVIEALARDNPLYDDLDEQRREAPAGGT